MDYDPDWDGRVETVCFGEITGDMLEGTYESYVGGQDTSRAGQWRAMRTCALERGSR
jgi:hypothetical protein